MAKNGIKKLHESDTSVVYLTSMAHSDLAKFMESPKEFLRSSVVSDISDNEGFGFTVGKPVGKSTPPKLSAQPE